ncbi:gluconate 2-dehydrogenase subunit 3 family protein [Pseudogracilibacillus sp. SO30301A]
MSAATERIFPKEDKGSGAIELGVPYFIDKQLNNSWGTNAHVYMERAF